MTSRTSREPEDSGHDAAVLVVAGVADVVVSGVSAAFGVARGFLGRNDKAAVAEDGVAELKARGRLAMDRYSTSEPAYLEVLAQHVESGRGRRDD